MHKPPNKCRPLLYLLQGEELQQDVALPFFIYIFPFLMAVLIICPSAQVQEAELQEVAAYLERYEKPFFLYLNQITVDYSINLYPNQLDLHIRQHSTGRSLAAIDIQAAWLYGLDFTEDFEVEDPALRNHLLSEYAATVEALIALLEFRGTRLVSKHSALIAHGSKIRQQFLAREVGFQIPQQLVSSSASAFLAADWSKSAVLKLVQSHTIMEEGGQLPYVQRVTEELYEGLQSGEIDTDVHYFQERLEQIVEYRIIAFGEEAYAFKIRGDYEVDWRQNMESIQFSYEPNCPLNARCIAYLKSADINFGSFDFIQTKEGYFFIECNSPGYFLFCDSAQEVGLAERFGRYLREG